MESLISLVQGSLSYLVPMIILLGLLIFVHELGHFLVAKYFKVRVEVFSLGFGPKIFKFKRGDTVYAISAIPLGGYVKMFGDDPTAEVSEEQKAYSFTSKPVGQRIAVVLAGPLMNFFFAILLFAGVAMIGEQTLAPKLGDISPTSTAYEAGFRSGDTILSVASQSVKSWDEMQKLIESNAGRSIAVEVQRGEGATETLQVTPKLVPNKNVLSWERQVGEVDGITFSSRASVVGIRDPQSPAGSAGLRTGDIILSVNGTPITKWRELGNQLKANAATGPISLEIERGLLDEKKAGEREVTTVSVSIPESGQGLGETELLNWFGVEFPELYLASLEEGSPATQAGLQKGDRIVSINNQEVHSFEDVATVVRSFGDQSIKDAEVANVDPSQLPPLAVVVSRAGELKEINVSPNLKDRMTSQGREERRFEIGIRPLVVEAAPATFQATASNPAQALVRGLNQTVKWTNLTVLSFVRLFQNEVSAKNIGGFLSIGQMAQKSWQIGISQFLVVMAIISINLFILNLLPVPVLDGGHLVFYSIEALQGAPLSMRKMEIAQQVGIVLLLGLMVFALFNDISRIFNPW